MLFSNVQVYLLERELETHNQHIDTVIMAAGNAINESRTTHSIEVHQLKL